MLKHEPRMNVKLRRSSERPLSRSSMNRNPRTIYHSTPPKKTDVVHFLMASYLGFASLVVSDYEGDEVITNELDRSVSVSEGW